MGVVTTVLGYIALGVAAGGAVYSASEANQQSKSMKGQREEAERKANAAEAKRVADEQAAVELAAAQVEERKRAMARNKADLTGPLGVEEGQQKVKTALGQ